MSIQELNSKFIEKYGRAPKRHASSTHRAVSILLESIWITMEVMYCRQRWSSELH